MKILSHMTWAAVIVLALASISSCREDSEEKYNPNSQAYGLFVLLFWLSGCLMHPACNVQVVL